MTAPRWGRAPSLDDLAALGEAALETIPAPLRGFVEGVVLRVDEFPDQETAAEMELESPYDLLGLYRGVHIGDKDSGFVAGDVDMIFLYRQPILDYWINSDETLDHLIRHVLIHEIGHHFGLSDADMEAIEGLAEGRD